MSSKRKICVITSVHRFNDRRIFDREAITLLNNGYSIDLIAPTDTQDFEYQGINIIGIPILPKRLRFINWFRILYKCFSGKYAVFHFHDPDLLFVGVILKIFTSSRVVYDVHEHYAARLCANRKDILVYSLIRYLVNTVEQLAARIIRNTIVVEKHMEVRFRNYGCHNVLLPNYARADNYQNIDLKEKDYNKRVIIHTGTLSVARGSLLMAELVKQVTDIDPTICFKFVRIFFAKNEEKALLTKINELGIQKQFQFIDWISPNKLLQILKEASIGLSVLMPYGQYHDKAVPTKLFEYMAAGLAIIAEDSPYNQEFVLKNHCGFLEPFSSVEKFRDRILKLINSPKQLRECGFNGRRAFLEKYNWELFEPALLKFYLSLK